MGKYAELILPLRLHQTYTYAIPEAVTELLPGCRALVSFGPKKYYTGVVASLHNQTPDFQVKELKEVLDAQPIITTEQLQLWKWMADYYMSPIGNLMAAALPAALKLESQTQLICNTTKANQAAELTSDQQAVWSYVNLNEKVKISQIQALDVPNPKIIVQQLVERQFLMVQESTQQDHRPKTEKFLLLSEKVKVENLQQDFKRSPKQLALMEQIAKNPQGIRLLKLKEQLDFSPASLQNLEQKGVVKVQHRSIEELEATTQHTPSFFKLSEAQDKAKQEIETLFETKNTVLLHGVTSSGKTEIFIELIRKKLENHQAQALYMLPEIAITTQIITRLKRAFGDQVCVYHSRLTAHQKAQVWKDIHANKKYRLILGVRSAIFLPFRNLSLIVVDEEHETSYKQYSATPYYHARDCAVVLASLFKAKTLLASATPSVESYHNARSGKYGLVNLHTRFNDFKLPSVEVIDKRHETKKKTMVAEFTPQLYQAVQEALQAKEQIILFQNRRGYAPYMQCADCGEILKCPNCEVSLTYHKFRGVVSCHYCNYTVSHRGGCTSCQSPAMQTKGLGTQKIEDNLSILFPEARVGRMDLDSTRAKDAHQRLITKFEEGKLDILVGTQMVTKGLDFSNVSLVGILDADAMLHFPDYKSVERSFQLMVQVSGRAGRSNGKGRVLIQTNSPEHKVFDWIQHTDFLGLYKAEIHERAELQYPPVLNLIKAKISHADEPTCTHFATQLSLALIQKLGPVVLGPEIPAIGRIQNKYIRNVYVKLPKTNQNYALKEQVIQCCDSLKKQHSSSLNIVYDVDPV